LGCAACGRVIPRHFGEVLLDWATGKAQAGTFGSKISCQTITAFSPAQGGQAATHQSMLTDWNVDRLGLFVNTFLRQIMYRDDVAHDRVGTLDHPRRTASEWQSSWQAASARLASCPRQVVMWGMKALRQKDPLVRRMVVRISSRGRLLRSH
jgi:hypothetical protein